MNVYCAFDLPVLINPHACEWSLRSFEESYRVLIVFIGAQKLKNFWCELILALQLLNVLSRLAWLGLENWKNFWESKLRFSIGHKNLENCHELYFLNFHASPVLALSVAEVLQKISSKRSLANSKVIGLCHVIELFYFHPHKVLTLLARTKQFKRRHRELLPFIYLNYFAFNFNAQLTSFRIWK